VKPYITIYTKENGKQEFTEDEWNKNRDKFSGLTYHRVDGPAVEYSDGYKSWFKEGRLHRIGDPAVEFHSNWWVRRDWYIEDEEYIKEDYDKLMREVKAMPLVLRLVDPRKWVRDFNLKTI
jgi:hypothetical protein